MFHLCSNCNSSLAGLSVATISSDQWVPLRALRLKKRAFVPTGRFATIDQRIDQNRAVSRLAFDAGTRKVP